ncbi:MAG TPA: hypothetical protein GX708_21820 [Gallicola sp.]|nr:hypothetical protein [Gallicola sp.]
MSDFRKSKKFKLTNQNCDYEISGTDDPYTLSLYRKDGKPLSASDVIPKSFYEMGIAIAITERQREGYSFFDYTMNNRLSDDNMQLIMTFQIKQHSHKMNKIKSLKLR